MTRSSIALPGLRVPVSFVIKHNLVTTKPQHVLQALAEKMALLRYGIRLWFFTITVCARSNAMRQFLQHHGEQIPGVFNGFDRISLSSTWLPRWTKRSSWAD
jgi:hypothetical protein